MKGLRMREGQEIEIEPEHARYIWVRGGLSKPVGMNIPVDPPRFYSRAGPWGRGYSSYELRIALLE